MPFLAEHLWQRLVVERCPDAPRSVFLAGWPTQTTPDHQLLGEVDQVRAVVDLGRQARSDAGMRFRQPLRQLVVDGAAQAQAYFPEIADELRVREVRRGMVEATELDIRPNLPVLGPRLGRDIGAVRKAIEAGDFRQLDDGSFEVAGHNLQPQDLLIQQTRKEGWSVASSDTVTVALDTSLDDGLLTEARVYDVIHHVNTLRKEAGLDISDRIRLGLPRRDADLEAYSARIASETLAVAVTFDADEQPRVEAVRRSSP
jgi:isoleucyl-tRNA synthetase